MEYNPSPFLHSKKIDDKLYRVEPYTYAVETELEDQKLILDNEGTVRDEEV